VEVYFFCHYTTSRSGQGKRCHFAWQHASCSAETSSIANGSFENVIDLSEYHIGATVVVIVVVVVVVVVVMGSSSGTSSSSTGNSSNG
jgi:hypothetical protein